jgi:hypothetical protein
MIELDKVEISLCGVILANEEEMTEYLCVVN